MTLQTLLLASLGLGVVAYLGLTVFCIVTWARRITGRAAFAASATTLLFLLALSLTGVGPVSLSFEAVALLCWMVLLLRVIGVGSANFHDPNLRPAVLVFGVALGLALIAASYPWILALGPAAGFELAMSWLFAGHLLLASCGLVLLEQVVRNTRDDYRWRLRYLNIGIGTLFCFELVHNALALMFGNYLTALVVVQPAIFALAVPFIAIASVRNPTNPLRLNLSRRFVFRGGMLIASGIALLLLGILGYLVQALDGDWGTAVLALVSALLVVGAVTLLGSSAVRLRVSRALEEHLFAHKYDYREEWRRVTEQLTEPSPDYDLAQQVLRALGGALQSPGGAVWRLSERGVLVPLSQLHTPWQAPLSPRTSELLKGFFERREWVLDLEDLPDTARPILAEAADIASLPNVRFLVPLMTDQRFFGIAAFTPPPGPLTLTWEDYDVLKLIARQASGFIALREAERELADAEKLRSFNQVSAFIIHDVKTIASQLSLLAENAGKHKTNPAFIDDMIHTLGNAVDRMQKLLRQLRDGESHGGEVVELGAELEQTVRTFNSHCPSPEIHLEGQPVRVAADPSKLRSAVGHLIQNAIDASNLVGSRCPRVAVKLCSRPPWAEVIVEDTGPGMDAHFIEKELFQPFTSTKGVAGMGVGAYQARSYVRSLGGDVSVDSRPGGGSRFIIRLPLEETT